VLGGHNAIAVGVNRREVDALERGAHTEHVGMTRRIRYFGGVEEGFCGNTSHVEAGATHLVLLDQSHSHTELAGA
jgi:hypothetical protein